MTGRDKGTVERRRVADLRAEFTTLAQRARSLTLGIVPSAIGLYFAFFTVFGTWRTVMCS